MDKVNIAILISSPIILWCKICPSKARILERAKTKYRTAFKVNQDSINGHFMKIEISTIKGDEQDQSRLSTCFTQGCNTTSAKTLKLMLIYMYNAAFKCLLITLKQYRPLQVKTGWFGKA